MTGTEPTATIQNLIRSDDTEALQAMLASRHSADVVELLGDVDPRQRPPGDLDR